MTNLDIHPEEIVCGGAEPIVAELLAPRDVPLGGPRAVKCAGTCRNGGAASSAPGATWRTTAPALPTVRMRPCG